MVAPTAPTRISRIVSRGLATCMLLALTSCFTMGLWGFELDSETDLVTGERDTGFVYDSRTEWSWKLVLVRILATPVTLVLDCLTAPVQAYLFFDDDDEDDDDC